MVLIELETRFDDPVFYSTESKTNHYLSKPEFH